MPKRKAVRRAVRVNSKPTTDTSQPTVATPQGVAVRLDNAEDADLRYIGNNRAEIQRRFPLDVATLVKDEGKEAQAQNFLPDRARTIKHWHDKRLAGIGKAWEAMDAVLHPVGNHEVHAISFIRDVDEPATDSNIGWFVSWNTPV